jgi:hypothetical protein
MNIFNKSGNKYFWELNQMADVNVAFLADNNLCDIYKIIIE